VCLITSTVYSTSPQLSIFRMCCQFQFFSIAFYTSYTFSVSNVYSHFCLTENNKKKICHDNQSPDSRYRGNSNSVRYIKFTSNNGQQATFVYNVSNTVTNLYRIINYPITNPQHNGTSMLLHCIEDRKQINDNLQHLQILGTL
jgi:hypothetical protein